MNDPTLYRIGWDKANELPHTHDLVKAWVKGGVLVPVEPDGVVIIEASDGYAGPKTRVSNGHLFVDLDQDINANHLPPGRYSLVRIGGDENG